MALHDSSSNAAADILEGVFHAHYSAFGRVLDFTPMAVGGQVSNQHYRVRTESGDFILKQLARPDALFQKAGNSRLEVVSQVVYELGRKGLEVERIEPTLDGTLCVPHGSSLFRLYRLVEGRAFDGGDQDRVVAARALRALHDRALELLDPGLAVRLGAFTTPYPIAETKPHLDQILEFLRREPNPALSGVAAHERLLREESEIAEAVATRSEPRRLVHLDFHPDNAIFTADGGVTMIDFDNVSINHPYKCLGFSVARFARASELREALRLWSEHYGFGDERPVLDFMSYVEIEKVLRIAYRVMLTGVYRNFLPNIAARHLPILMAIREIRARL